MELNEVVAVFGALGQRTRFDAVQLLLRHEADGMSSGEVARVLKVPAATMSAHLARLTQAGLLRKERKSRNIIYRADRKRIAKTLSELLDTARSSSKRAGGSSR